MNQILVPQSPPPSGFRALFSLRRGSSRSATPSSHPEAFRIRNLLDPKRLTHADIRNRCKFYIDELFKPIEPHERSNKALFRKVARATGLGMQRVERLWRRYITKPDGLELAVLGTAYFQRLDEARARDLAAPAEQGAADGQTNLGGAVDYSASRWDRSAGSRQGHRASGAAKPSAENAD